MVPRNAQHGHIPAGRKEADESVLKLGRQRPVTVHMVPPVSEEAHSSLEAPCVLEYFIKYLEARVLVGLIDMKVSEKQ